MYRHQWMTLDAKKREELAAKHGIVRSENIEVYNNVVKRDGYSDEDIAQIPESELELPETDETVVGKSNPNERDEDSTDSRENKTAVTNKEGTPGDTTTLHTADLGADGDAQANQIADAEGEVDTEEDADLEDSEEDSDSDDDGSEVE